METQATSSLVKELSTLRESQTVILKWNSDVQSWKKWSEPNSQLIGYKLKENQSVQTIAFNVLIDTFKNKPYKQTILFSELRYRYTLEKIGQNLPHTASFNEVTETFYEILKEQQWVRQNYWISYFTGHQKGFGNVIISRIKPIFSDSIKVKTLPRPVQAIFLPIQAKNKLLIVCICAVHLIALSTNAKKRQNQFDSLMEYLKRYQKYVDCLVLQGDMNFHSEGQNYIYKRHNLRDSWLQKYQLKENPGFTFNSEQNSLINEIYWGFQKRKMRLDRVLYRGPQIHTSQIRVIFNEPMYEETPKQKVNHHWFGKGSLLFINDFFGWGMGRENKEKFLFPSDHYGLMAKMVFDQE